jgi:hypothetical protein
VPDADLRQGYDGLNKKVPLLNLGKGEFVAFVNRKKDKVKLCTGNDMIAYLRLPQGQKIDPRVIQYLPEFFDGPKIKYDKAIEKVLRGTFPKWFDQKKGATK